MLSHACHMLSRMYDCCHMHVTCTYRWRVELYLTPSHLMFTTAGVLCALAIGMAIIIALLHAREKVRPHTVLQLLSISCCFHCCCCCCYYCCCCCCCSTRTIRRENKQNINFISMQCNSFIIIINIQVS